MKKKYNFPGRPTMSVSYKIDTTLNIPFATDNISSILQNAKKTGFSFHVIDLKNPQELGENLSPQEATEQITYKLNEEKFPAVAAKIEATHFYLFMYENDGHLELNIHSFYYPWHLKFNNKIEVDINKYARLVLKIIEPFEIINFTISKN